MTVREVERYGIYLANLDPTVGSEMKKVRPVAVVSPNAMNRYLNTIVICPLTSKLHSSWRSRVYTAWSEKGAEIAVDQIRTISKVRLIKQLGKLSSGEGGKVQRLISELYGDG